MIEVTREGSPTPPTQTGPVLIEMRRGMIASWSGERAAKATVIFPGGTDNRIGASVQVHDREFRIYHGTLRLTNKPPDFDFAGPDSVGDPIELEEASHF